MRLQLPQSGGDTGLTFREAGAEGLDVHPGAVRYGLDVHGQADREQGQFAVLGQVVADHREALAMTVADVDDTGSGPVGRACPSG
ncbi:hypothetical protein ADL27_27520 [Streptomyces sp. NRRL F-6602]|nr:hypothetical protein ADL27_27520 [Streptomyces sp. NRRL F-6602]